MNFKDVMLSYLSEKGKNVNWLSKKLNVSVQSVYAKERPSINFYDFRSAFEDLRPNNFSYEGITVLWEYFQEYEESTDTEIELDIISICCDYTQSTIKEALDVYDLNSLEELEEQTIVIPVNEDEVIYLNY